jgi:C1A family cysteine protease
VGGLQFVILVIRKEWIKMKKLMIPIMVPIMVFIFVGYVWAGMPNPAAVYCSELGYQVKTITQDDGGQYSVCVFPDGNICDAWQFLEGKCGEEYSYCAINGYGQIIKTDGKNSFSGTYPVCVDGSTEIGNPLDLMGITARLLKQSLSENELLPVKPSPQETQSVLGGLERLEGALPSRFDWRTYNGFDWMTPVKDQNQCGACWAFGSVGTVEAVYNLHQNQPNLDINLSEEYVSTNCNGNGWHGCCGGRHEEALAAIRDNGVPDDACLVYDVAGYSSQDCLCDAPNGTGDDCRGTCPNKVGDSDMCSLAFCDDACFDVARRLVRIADYYSVGDTVDDIKAALIAHGPLTTAIQFDFAKHGGSYDSNTHVYNCGGCGNSCGTDHCVIITGWDDNVDNLGAGAWIIKNSWGNNDGEPNHDGYRYIAYNDCNVQDRVVWVQPADYWFPVISIPKNITFADTCVGVTSFETLDICNTGKADLSVYSIASSDPQFVVTTPLMDCHDLDGDGIVEAPDECSGGYSVNISPDFCYPFEVQFSPTSAGQKTATLTVRSNDMGHPAVRIQATGNVPTSAIQVSPNPLSFGNVPVASIGGETDYKDLSLKVRNTGACNLSVTGIASSGGSAGDFTLLTPTPGFPTTISPDAEFDFTVRFNPSASGSRTTTIRVTSNSGGVPGTITSITANGVGVVSDIKVSGSAEFGDVCAGTLAEKTVSICNNGNSNLNVTSVAFNPACSDFTLINSPFPTSVSPDSCMDVTIRFTPTSAGPKSCSLVISSNDPGQPTITLTVTANTPFASIDVSPDQSFLPEVIQSVGACTSQMPFPISNTGKCNLNITNITIPVVGDYGDYSLSGLPSFPIILEPGHIAGEGNLKTVFAPTALDRDRLGNVTVTYVSEPVTGATTNVTRALCGEGVRTGARVLVTVGGVPMDVVKKIQIQRITSNRNKKIVDTVDVAQNVPLTTVTPGSPCQPFKYHKEYGTVSNPLMLLPGSYKITATVVVNGKNKSQTVAFDLSTCDFNPNIIINF